MFGFVYIVIVPTNSLWLLHRFCWNLIYTNPKTLTRRINPNFDICTVTYLVEKLITLTVPVVAEICCLTTNFEQEFGIITKHKTFKKIWDWSPSWHRTFGTGFTQNRVRGRKTWMLYRRVVKSGLQRRFQHECWVWPRIRDSFRTRILIPIFGEVTKEA